ncbi:hypothetical protein SBDP1_950034 [Syntrophobacter sp. SbD1]|nr:hypothetical protein SBDP1_950034 [Syntrophobacter sp. SbD1]
MSRCSLNPVPSRNEKRTIEIPKIGVRILVEKLLLKLPRNSADSELKTLGGAEYFSQLIADAPVSKPTSNGQSVLRKLSRNGLFTGYLTD